MTARLSAFKSRRDIHELAFVVRDNCALEFGDIGATNELFSGLRRKIFVPVIVANLWLIFLLFENIEVKLAA